MNALSGAANTLTLDVGLIYSGQTVDVVYTDPTSGDDAVAIQDAAGNEAATFTFTVVNGSTQQRPTVPDPPTGLTATAQGRNRINLSWTAPANDGGAPISGYKIERSSDTFAGQHRPAHHRLRRAVQEEVLVVLPSIASTGFAEGCVHRRPGVFGRPMPGPDRRAGDVHGHEFGPGPVTDLGPRGRRTVAEPDREPRLVRAGLLRGHLDSERRRLRVDRLRRLPGRSRGARRDVRGGRPDPLPPGLALRRHRRLVDHRRRHRQGSVVHAGINDSAMFHFFGPNNWEVLIKVLDGCAINGHVWVFGAATTDLGYAIRATDTVTGTAKQYRNEPGMPAPAITDATAFAESCRSR